MERTGALIYSEAYQAYELSPAHPFSPLRWRLTWELVDSMGLTAAATVVEPEPAASCVLQRVHTREYIEAVRTFGQQLARGEPAEPNSRLYRHGLAGSDTPAFPRMHEAASLLVGGTVLAGELVFKGEVEHAVNFAGGLHHAMPNRASGFCVYNDVAVLIAWLRSLGLRVAYVDLDAHHGDGVQHAFYDDPGVLTFSVHEDGRYLFPGTGFAAERGCGEAEGTKWNVPLPPRAGDDELLGAVEGRLPAILHRFSPDFLVTQHGCDGHARDPLTHLNYTMRSLLRLPLLMHKFAHEYAGGRWVAVGGGGYATWWVVPRAWAALCSEALHVPLNPDSELPAQFIESWQDKSPVTLPLTFGEDDS